MYTMARRSGMLASVVMLMVSLLAACGGAATVSPEDRVKAFFNDFNSALSEPKLSDAAKQDEWADKLAKYFLPATQSAQKTSVKEMLGSMGQAAGTAGAGTISMKIEGVMTAKVAESGDDAQVRITGGKIMMSAAGQTQEQDLSKAGLTGGSDTIKLRKEGGVWYLTEDK